MPPNTHPPPRARNRSRVSRRRTHPASAPPVRCVACNGQVSSFPLAGVACVGVELQLILCYLGSVGPPPNLPLAYLPDLHRSTSALFETSYGFINEHAPRWTYSACYIPTWMDGLEEPAWNEPDAAQLDGSGRVDRGSQLLHPDQRRRYVLAAWQCYIAIYHWSLPWPESPILIGRAMWQMDGEACQMAIKRRLVPKRSDPASPISTAHGDPSEVCFKDLHDRCLLAQLLEKFKTELGSLPREKLRKRFHRAVKELRVSLPCFNL